MKNIFIVFVLLLAAVISLPAMSQKHKKAHVYQSGTVMNFPKGSQTYIIVPDSDPNKRYVPTALADEFKKDNLKVEFIGVEGEIPPNVRMVGTPFRLKDIRLKK